MANSALVDAVVNAANNPCPASTRQRTGDPVSVENISGDSSRQRGHHKATADPAKANPNRNASAAYLATSETIPP